MLLLFSCPAMSDSVTPWTAAHQASLSLTISQSFPKFMFIASVMSSSHLILTLFSVSSTGRKRKYTQLNAEFQRIARRHMKAFLNEQYKEIEENNRMGEISSRKLEIQGNISCKDGHNKGQKWQGPNRSRGD